MPLNVRKFGASWFLVLFVIGGVFAQSTTSVDVMRERITKVKAMVALKNYTAAIYELEGIRRETNDPTLHSVAQVMLMNCYLEQADYKRAQTLLTELYNAQKTNKPNANYYAVAAQVVKGARNQLERYKSLGLSVSDRNLPANAVADVDKMRETVETVVTQTKTLGENKKDSSSAIALLEEATNARSSLARDDYDAKRWKEEVADARESLMSSRSVVNAVDDSAVQTNVLNTVAGNTSAGVPKPSESTASVVPVSGSTANSAVNTDNQPKIETAKPEESVAQSSKSEQPSALRSTPETTPPPSADQQTAQTQNSNSANTASNNQGPTRSRRVQSDASQTAQNADSSNQNAAAGAAATSSDAPLVVGSLIDYATEKVNPTYPPAAKTMRQTGVVRVEVLVNENGQVSVENTSGPSMLRSAALDALKKWKFKPFVRDGQPVKAKGFVNFNFNL